MNTAIWDVGEVKPITLVTSKNLDISAEVALVSSGSFTSSAIVFQPNAGGYYGMYSFSGVGSYVIKLTDGNGNIDDLFITITVKYPYETKAESDIRQSLLITAHETTQAAIQVASDSILTDTSSLEVLATAVAAIPLETLTAEQSSHLLQLVNTDLANVQSRVDSIPTAADTAVAVWNKAI
jgi:hypothetical protein